MTMKRLITTTAIAALLGAPLAAQTQTETQSGQAQTQPMSSAQMEIEASTLIGKRLYIQRDGSGQTDATQQESGQRLDVEVRPGDEATTETAEGTEMEAPENGEAATDQTAEQQPAQDQVDQQTQPSQQAEGQQPAQGEQMQQAEGQPQGTQQTTTDMAQTDMAQMEQGVPDVPEGWTMAGEIDDVLLSQDGQVQALVVDTGGFLGMNEATRRIDIQEVRFVPDTDDEGEFFAVYTGDQQALQGAEAFDEAALQEGTLRGTETWGDELAGSQADIAFTSITTDELLGTAVYGSNDNWVGEIGELALTEDGEIEAVIIDVGGFLGIGEKPVALSMDQIQLRRGEGGAFGDDLRAYVNATEEELESMEAWEEDAG
jgi:hypothetical protein